MEHITKFLVVVNRRPILWQYKEERRKEKGNGKGKKISRRRNTEGEESKRTKSREG